MGTASNLLLKFSKHLFSQLEEQEQFMDALLHPKPFHPSILWCQPKPIEHPFLLAPSLPWQPEFVDRLAIASKPGQHPLHQQGYYYCLDFSSVFAASSLLTIVKPGAIVLDMCAAPGGKSVFAWKALQPNLLLSNEVIGKRIGALLSNLKRCIAHHRSATDLDQQIILSLDSKILANIIPGTVDVVLVDAPCTGQSLLAKGEQAPGCFHPVTINKNANRQKRILANSAQVVAPQGYLAYMTCAYSPEENEQVSQWLMERFPHLKPLIIPHLAPYQSHLADFPCYRLFPHSELGAGAFTVLLQNTTDGVQNSLSPEFLQQRGFIHLYTGSEPKPWVLA